MSENKQSAAEALPTTELNEAELESVAGGSDIISAAVDVLKAEYELAKLAVNAVTGS